MLPGHEADQFSEHVVAKNTFEVLGHVLGNGLVTAEVLGIGETHGNGRRSLHTCIRDYVHGRDAHGRQPVGKLVLKVANFFCHHNGSAHQHCLPIVVDPNEEANV